MIYYILIKEKKIIKKVFSFESGFDFLGKRFLNFSNNFFMFLIIFILFEIEIIYLIILIFKFIDFYFFIVFFVMLVIFGLILEWKIKNLIWYI